MAEELRKQREEAKQQVAEAQWGQEDFWRVGEESYRLVEVLLKEQ